MSQRTVVRFAAPIFLFAVAALLPLGLADTAGAAEEEGKPEILFTDTYKCNMCHPVAAAKIVRRTRSERMQGPDLSGLKAPKGIEALGPYLRQEIEREGNLHRSPFKGTDEELQAIVDWLGSLEAQE